MLSTIAGETRFGVFEPRAFVVVLRMALQRATAEVAGIAIIKGISARYVHRSDHRYRRERERIWQTYPRLQPANTQA